MKELIFPIPVFQPVHKFLCTRKEILKNDAVLEDHFWSAPQHILR